MPSPVPERSLQILKTTGLQRQHFADLIRAAQVIVEPSNHFSVAAMQDEWEDFEISQPVLENLVQLGDRYRYAAPTVAIDQVWEQLTPETRSWLIENRNNLWQFEEIFPALDED
ncbi:MAG TPA: hypothetical protein IGS37_07220 [Synechococcales cyanobacterium M55_K2018_004]|nr:hypothetical protein [Synechococcales cyanobacterium M55_K2018_004]